MPGYVALGIKSATERRINPFRMSQTPYRWPSVSIYVNVACASVHLGKKRTYPCLHGIFSLCSYQLREPQYATGLKNSWPIFTQAIAYLHTRVTIDALVLLRTTYVDYLGTYLLTLRPRWQCKQTKDPETHPWQIGAPWIDRLCNQPGQSEGPCRSQCPHIGYPGDEGILTSCMLFSLHFCCILYCQVSWRTEIHGGVIFFFSATLRSIRPYFWELGGVGCSMGCTWRFDKPHHTWMVWRTSDLRSRELAAALPQKVNACKYTTRIVSWTRMSGSKRRRYKWRIPRKSIGLFSPRHLRIVKGKQFGILLKDQDYVESYSG